VADSPPRVSVVIPVKDDPPLFDAVASILADPATPADAEIVVVDNGSTPAFRAQLAGLPARVRVIDEPTPGPAAARNRALREVAGDVVFFTDADCVVHAEWIARGLQALAETGADIVRGYDYAITTTPASALIWRHGGGGRRPGTYRAPGTVRADARNMAVRRTVFESLTFNEQALRAEDIEFGMEAHARGFRIVACPEMSVGHLAEARLEEYLAKRVASGWALRRLAMERPDLEWPDPFRQSPSRGAARRLLSIPGARAVLPLAVWLTILQGRVAGRIAPRLPSAAGYAVVRFLTLVATALGGALYGAGFDRPAPGDVLRGRLGSARSRKQSVEDPVPATPAEPGDGSPLSAIGEAALALARLGFAVVPEHEVVDGSGCSCGCAHEHCWRRAKHPRIPDWERQATSDPETIRRWWRRWPNANIGIVPGKSGLVVVDVDLDADGRDRLPGFLARHPEAAATLRSQTGSGGWHLMFRKPPEKPLRTAKGILGAGIDVQAEDGLVTVPPSLHYNGCRYAWADGLGPAERPPIPLPPALEGALLKRPGLRWYLALAPYWVADRVGLSMDRRQQLRRMQARLHRALGRGG